MYVFHMLDDIPDFCVVMADTPGGEWITPFRNHSWRLVRRTCGDGKLLLHPSLTTCASSNALSWVFTWCRWILFYWSICIWVNFYFTCSVISMSLNLFSKLRGEKYFTCIVRRCNRRKKLRLLVGKDCPTKWLFNFRGLFA